MRFACSFVFSCSLLAATVPAQAGSPWLEQCHGLPAFSSWKVEPSAYGSAKLVYLFHAHCAEETELFGHDEESYEIKGTWDPGTGQAFEYITKTYFDNPHATQTGTDTVSLLYQCLGGDPWQITKPPTHCKLSYCTASDKGLCGIAGDYKTYPITFGRVPIAARVAARNVLTGPVVVTAPQAGMHLNPGYAGQIQAELRGHAPSPLHVLAFSWQQHQGTAWAIPFPQLGHPIMLPRQAACSGPQTSKIACAAHAPLTYDAFTDGNGPIPAGEWRVQACAEGSENTLCSNWVPFVVTAPALPYKYYERELPVRHLPPIHLESGTRN